MATFTYECSHCDTVYDVQQKLSESPLTECEKCGSEYSLKRLITGNAGGFRIGGVLNSTSMYNVSGDPGPRRKGYDCDPMN